MQDNAIAPTPAPFLVLTVFLKEAGVKKITIGGNGDPFMHPQIIEILKLSKSTGAFVSVSTKGAYFMQNSLESLVKMDLDERHKLIRRIETRLLKDAS